MLDMVIVIMNGNDRWRDGMMWITITLTNTINIVIVAFC